MEISSTIKKIINNWFFWLIIITGTAIFLRSIPSWIHTAWGCDFGIYYGITNTVVETGEFFPNYTGWGSSYNEFPVLYAIVAFAHWVTGIDVISIMPKIIPILGGLTVTIFYFIVYELLKNKKIALLSSLFLAVLPFHVYQLSHSSPLTVGHFFMMVSFYLFIKLRQNTIYSIPLYLSTMLLIMSHHLTSYFYLISIFFIIYIENASQKNWTETFFKDITYLIGTTLLMFSYWAFIATTVYEGFMRSGLNIINIKLDSIIIIILFYILLLLVFSTIIIKRKYNIFLKKNMSSTKKNLYKISIFTTIATVVLLIFTFIEMPWTNFNFTITSVLYSLPLIIVAGLGYVGFSYTYFIKNGPFIRGWFLSILISFGFALLTNNTIILPHRHLEYLMVPLAVIAVIGLGGLFNDFELKSLIKNIKDKKDYYLKNINQKIKISHKKRITFLLIIIILFISLAASVYPSHSSLNQSNEIITKQDVELIEWFGENIDKNNSLIASDHRLERMAEAEGFNTTKDETIDLWIAEDLPRYIDELSGIGNNYSRITHVIIDNIMKDDVVHIGFKKDGLHMTNETWDGGYKKFLQPPFELVKRIESLEINQDTLEPVQWAEIYKINWTYIEKEIYLKN